MKHRPINSAAITCCGGTRENRVDDNGRSHHARQKWTKTRSERKMSPSQSRPPHTWVKGLSINTKTNRPFKKCCCFFKVDWQLEFTLGSPEIIRLRVEQYVTQSTCCWALTSRTENHTNEAIAAWKMNSLGRKRTRRIQAHTSKHSHTNLKWNRQLPCKVTR